MSKPSSVMYALAAILDAWPAHQAEPVTWAQLREVVKAAADEQADTEWQEYMGADL